jgi:hypothetical protein
MYLGLWLLSAGHVSTLLHPHCTLVPSPYAYKRKVQGSHTRRLAARENGLADSLSLSPSRTLVTPYCKRTRPGRRTTRRSRVSHFAVLTPSCSVSRRPIWVGTRGDNSLVGPGTLRGRNADRRSPCVLNSSRKVGISKVACKHIRTLVIVYSM